MGSNLFKGQSGKLPSTGGGGISFARAINSGAYAGRAAGGAQQKDLAAAQALYKARAGKPSVRSAAFAPGPKKV
jgi:hypothetical protein